MFALDEDFGNLIVLENRNPCFVGARGDDHLLGHARSSPGAVAEAHRFLPRARARTSAAPRRAQPSAAQPLENQFVNRRIRTLRIRPNPASVAIIEETT